MRMFVDIYVFVVQMRWIAGKEVVLDLFTLTFDSSPIKGEGIMAVGVGLLSLALWIPACAGMTVSGCFGLLLHHPVDTALKPV